MQIKPANNIFPIGKYSRNDVEFTLNNLNDLQYQNVSSAVPATYPKQYYGFNYILGDGTATVANKYVTFSVPINNILGIQATSLGYNGTTQTPSDITGTTPSGTSVHIAGITSAGMSARIVNNVAMALNTAYVFNYVITYKNR